MNRQALHDLKQQIPLLGYLQAHDWRAARPLSRGRLMGLCPLHDDRQPSFLVDPHKNLRAAQVAQTEAYGDVRTSSTVCTDHLDAAVKSLENAAQWISEYRKEVLADERRSISVAKPAPKPKEDCHICDNEIDPDDVAVCGGCDKPTCPDCMGDEGICKECETEE